MTYMQKQPMTYLLLALFATLMAIAGCQQMNSAAPDSEAMMDDGAMDDNAMMEMAPSVIVEDQSLLDGTVVIAGVSAAEDGFIVIHRDEDGSFAEVIGQAPVKEGINTDVVVEIDAEMATETLYAMLHVDAGEIGVYEFPGPDVPVVIDGASVSPPFMITEMMMDDEAMGDEEMMEMTPSVTVMDQPLHDGMLVIAEVVAAEDGFIVIHRDEGGSFAEVIGQAPVKAGANTDVMVEIDVEMATETLYAMLHIDAGTVGTYEFPGPDGPVIVDDAPVSPPFMITEMMMDDEAMGDDMTSDVVLPVGQLRTALHLLLGEHVLLASSATEAALRGRGNEFDAAAAALDANSIDIAAAIGLVYGSEAEEAFLPLWRTHIGFFVDYTMARANDDESARTDALLALDGYAEDFGAFLASANPNFSQEEIATNLRMHVKTLTAVIDAQAVVTPQESGDQLVAYPALRTAYAHMGEHALALATGIAKQFPERFPGDAGSDAATLRAGINTLLAEHAFLVAKSADAALDSRNIEYEAVFAALDQNSQELAAAIGSVYGQEAADAFLPLWRKHIGFFIDFSLGLIGNNEAAQTDAVNELVGYASDFAAFLNSANPNLPVDAVTGLVTTHAQTTLLVIGAGEVDDPGPYYLLLRDSMGHMGMIANPLSDAIVAQFPDRFESAMMDDSVDDDAMNDDQAEADEEGDSDGEAMDSGDKSVAIDIKTFSFGEPLEIEVGTTVTWTNQDAIEHTVTSGAPGAITDAFDSDFFVKGETFSHTFTEEGEFTYFCQRHPSMIGSITVVAVQ